MPFVVSTFTPTPAGGPFNTTVQNILNAVSQDMLREIGAENPAVLDYVNRISLELLRTSRWKFLLGPAQRFITQSEQTDYWVGPSGSQPNNVYDTNLNLTDFGLVKENSVVDRSNFVPLQRIGEEPLASQLGFPDALMRPGKPKLWRNDPTTPNVINIYPAPDETNSYTPLPPSPFCTAGAGGALAQRTYYVRVTYVDSLGLESQASDRDTVFTIPANQLITVHPPDVGFTPSAQGVTYSSYNVYISTSKNSGTKQNTSPISTAVTWTEPTSGLISTGPIFPSTSSITPLNGYVIEFRYYKSRIQLINSNQVLQIPDDYKDIVIAGVNWMIAQFLTRADAAQYWLTIYKDGIRQIIRDKNLGPKGPQDYMTPDATGIMVRYPSIETVNVANELII